MSTLSTARKAGLAAGALSLVLGGTGVALAAPATDTLTGTLPVPLPSPTVTLPALPLPGVLPSPTVSPTVAGVPLPALPVATAPAPTPAAGPVTTETGTSADDTRTQGSRARSVPVTPKRTAAETAYDTASGTAALSSLGFTGASLYGFTDSGASGPLLLPGIAAGDLGFGEEPSVALPLVPGAEQRIVPAGVTSPSPAGAALPGLAVLIALTTLGGAAAGHVRTLRSRFEAQLAAR